LGIYLTLLGNNLAQLSDITSAGMSSWFVLLKDGSY